ncbi:MAG: hypothetical protein IPK81_11585 [Rhodospirillales bacterium]|nr:MAG: hypothetical protein IPK81_11585 [Rhodospirillales bacterium]
MTSSPAAPGRLTAVLGPTNTGKTHLAMERMLGHGSGMIGFPLRLLARENYDRAVRQVGARRVALITGEEKISPPNPDFLICTVESMPLERPVRFLAVDEIQMAADPERGHLFTDRLLRARGLDETMLLGADTMRPLLRSMFPGIDVVARPRFSTLSFAGAKKVTRLPARSAIVGFSASEVYALAELVRRQRGGCAVVMGALSPRTRNAQVAMFQAGEVDYLVATDAIGMGLNMDVTAVWFSGLRKFDGRGQRPLRNEELAQIAGRAGRHMSDGSYGTPAEYPPVDQEQVEAIEGHRFDPVRFVQWRNHDLDFGSIKRLMDSLSVGPDRAGLQRARDADDVLALAALATRPEVSRAAVSVQRTRLLWDVCQVPDFRKTLSEEHTTLLTQLYGHLTSGDEKLPEDWVDSHVKRLERYDGDIDTLMGRIAHTRTWTYVSHRAGWLERAAHWQERARAIEDKLSDALHQRLTQRFVDRRTALLVRKLKEPEDLMTGVTETGEISVEGETLGRLEGFRFVPEAASSEGADQKTAATAAMRALRQEMPARLERFAACGDVEIGLDAQLRITWKGGAIARLLPGADALSPKVEPLSSDLLDGPGREIVRKRCADWLEASIKKSLPDLMQARAAELSGPARGLVFQLGEALGAMQRAPVEAQIAAMNDEDRKALARAGVRVGVYTVYIPTMLKPGAIRVRALLWAIARGRDAIPALPSEGRTSVALTPEMDRDFLASVGYLTLGDRAIRADMVERLAWMARTAVRNSREAHKAALDRKAAESAPAAAAPASGESAAAKPTAAAPVTSTDGSSKTPTGPSQTTDEVNEWMIAAAALGEAMDMADSEDLAAAKSANDDHPQDAPDTAAVAPESAPAPAEAAPPVAETAPAPAEAAPAETAPAPAETATPAAEAAPAPAEPALPPNVPVWNRPSRELAGAVPVAEIFSLAERRWITVEAPHQPAGGKGKGKGQGQGQQQQRVAAPPAPALPPGHFRAAPEMLSLVGCGEAEMAGVLRGLGYRVHQPPEDAPAGSFVTFSVKPRFVREREARQQDGGGRREGGRDGERQGDRRPPWRRERGPDDRPPRPSRDTTPGVDLATASGGEARARPTGDGKFANKFGNRRFEGPRRDGAPGGPPAGGAPRGDGPRGDGPPAAGERKFGGGGPGGERKFGGGGGPRGDRRGGPGGDFRGERRGNDRDRMGGPETRLVASTEKKGDNTADSPFAKLLELNLGRKK